MPTENLPNPDKAEIQTFRFIHMKKTGFTLVELLIAVAIISIFAAIAVPAYNGYVEEARENSARSTALSIKPHLEEHYLETGTYTGWTNTVADTEVLTATTLDDDGYSLTIKIDDNHSYTFTKSEL